MATFLLRGTLACLMALATFSTHLTLAQDGLETSFQVSDANDQVDVIAGNSRRLSFDYKVPELLVENPDIVKATPIAPNEILVTGLKPGISSVTVSDPNRRLQTITVNVTADVRRLEAALHKYFPDCNIKVHALQTGVILAGTVSRNDQINNVMAVARDYFPSNVINQLKIDTHQLVAIKVKVYEVSRTKLRKLGIDWAVLNNEFTAGTSIANLINNISIGARTVTGQGQTMTFGVVGDNTDFVAFMDALEQHNLAKLLDQPTLVAQHGRPAEFLSGGEIPIAVASGLGTTSIEFRPFGTKLDIVPLIHGHGELTLEVRAEVSEIANDLSNNTNVPGFRVRRVNTGVRMKAGHTLALAGDYREETETEKRGIPHLMHSPIWGAAFRKNEETRNETELVFAITPRFITEVDPTRVPSLGPGQLTDSPSDHELYLDGYMEVPRCKDDCPTHDRFDDPATQYAPPVQSQLEQTIHGQSILNLPASHNNGATPTFQPHFETQPAPAGAYGPATTDQSQSSSGFDYPTQSRLAPRYSNQR